MEKFPSRAWHSKQISESTPTSLLHVDTQVAVLLFEVTGWRSSPSSKTGALPTRRVIAAYLDEVRIHGFALLTH